MQLDSDSEKQILHGSPTTQRLGAARGLEGSKAFRVPLWFRWKTTWASQPFGQDLPSSYTVGTMFAAGGWGGAVNPVAAVNVRPTSRKMNT
ncbi:MAG TPA: hypothetical protein VGB98_22545 [Pyrinomonadaceae bacterium]|jgi:hypothetical protein